MCGKMLQSCYLLCHHSVSPQRLLWRMRLITLAGIASRRLPPPSIGRMTSSISPISPLLHRAEEQSGLEILFPLSWKRDITGVQTAKLYPGIFTISGILLCIEVSILACEDNRRDNYITAQRVCGKASYTQRSS